MDKIMEAAFSFEDQAFLVLSAIEANDQFYYNSHNLCIRIESTLKVNLQKLQFFAKPFGSVVTQLALKDSDIDIFLDFGK